MPIVSFVEPMTVNAVSVYAGSDGLSERVVLVDAAIETSVDLQVAAVGGGSVAVDPAGSSYRVGDVVTLTAVEAPGWTFDGWSGDVASLENPLVLTLAGDTQVTAAFVEVPDPDPPVVSDLLVRFDETSATIAWTTDEPASSRVDYGPDAGLGSAVVDTALVTDHAVTLPGLTASTPYSFRVESDDAAGNVAQTAIDDFVTASAPGPGPVADSFGAGGLDTTVWSFVNPLGDASLRFTDTHAEIAIGATGNVHDAWTDGNTLPRLRQAVPDADFAFVARFDSALTASFQSQGVLIEQSDADVVRFEAHHLNGSTRIYAATILGGVAQQRALVQEPVTAPLWLRVERAGNTFTLSWSLDGASYTTAASFVQPLAPSGIGVYAGNSATTPFTARVDAVWSSLDGGPDDGD